MAPDYFYDKKGKFIMICNKCGAQCDENQAFCLKCGNPIQLTADFNLIEKELASNIDELLNEIESNGESLPEEADELKTIDVPLEEINMGLKVMDINRGQSKREDDLFEDEEEDITPVLVPGTRREGAGKPSGRTANGNKKNNKTKKSNKKLYAIIGVVAVAIIALVVTLVLVLGGDDDEDTTKKGFGDYYSTAETSYGSGDMDKALEMAYEALAVVQNDSDEIKVRKLINNIYNQQNFAGATYLDNIEKLIALGDSSEDYYGVMVAKYIEDKNTEMLVNIMTKIDEEKAKEYFGENFVEIPAASEESGEFKNFVTIALSAAEGCKIYYAINDDVTKNATEYVSEIEFSKTGEYIVSAYAVNELGIPSFVAEYTYNIIEGEAAGPAVTPEAGTYTKPTEITVEVPEGGKAYYTYTEDGEQPNESSTEYTEPVEMLRGANKFMVVVVDKFGNISEATTVQYNLKLDRTESITSGQEKVWAHFYNNGKIDPDGNLADGSVLEVSYEDAVVIDNAEYYVYTAVATLTVEDSVTTTGITYVAVNTYDGTVIEGLTQVGGEYILPEIPE